MWKRIKYESAGRREIKINDSFVHIMKNMRGIEWEFHSFLSFTLD